LAVSIIQPHRCSSPIPVDGKGESGDEIDSYLPGPPHKGCQLGTPAVIQPVKYLLKKDMLCNINSVNNNNNNNNNI